MILLTKVPDDRVTRRKDGMPYLNQVTKQTEWLHKMTGRIQNAESTENKLPTWYVGLAEWVQDVLIQKITFFLCDVIILFLY